MSSKLNHHELSICIHLLATPTDRATPHLWLSASRCFTRCSWQEARNLPCSLPGAKGLTFNFLERGLPPFSGGKPSPALLPATRAVLLLDSWHRRFNFAKWRQGCRSRWPASASSGRYSGSPAPPP
ncbi:Heparanase-like protein 3 [Zea mays]|uniref:Heparanase-like protein 3 n=1 Tax=Zea mays TaxID=4577 RepID=A0A1D6QBZ5_MAIZE|nr:Heparanase-like protein 3 [Zea mays]AQK55759.1 Heparanase-like protein 3 [Zea mays]AQK55761.1 Heparanase-like protein 3 [Zea mays]